MHASIERVTTFLQLTDRGLWSAEKLTHFRLTEVPKNGVILNAGSGMAQRFEEEVHQKRKDVQVISLDPSIFQRRYNFTEGFYYKLKVETLEDIRQRLCGDRSELGA